MANSTKWNDEYWLLLLQLYLRKPVGVKSTYCRDTVDLALELHIRPDVLAEKMKAFATLSTPRIERIVSTYAANPRRLARAVRLLREMKGFNNADEFYDGVETNETFELMFRPVAADTELSPIMLTLILELYFRLTPITMSVETPEVVELAKLMHLKPETVVEALLAFQQCDPYLNRKSTTSSLLSVACQTLWHRYASDNPDALVRQAEEMKEYFK